MWIIRNANWLFVCVATNNDDIEEPILDASNGVSSEEEEEEPSMPGPQVELGEAARSEYKN